MQFMLFSSKHDLFQHANKKLEVVWHMKNVFHSFLNRWEKTRRTHHRVEKPRALDDCHGFRDSGPINNWLHLTLGIKISCNGSKENVCNCKIMNSMRNQIGNVVEFYV